MKLRTGLTLALVMPAIALFTGYAENPPQGTAPDIKDYVAAHYGEIQDDLHNGDGVYLTSLLNMLHIPAEEKEGTIKRLRGLSDAYPTPPEFADRVPDLVHKGQAPSVPAAGAMSEPDLENLFAHMKYKTRIHLSMLNGDEIDGIFSSFDRSQERIWMKPTNLTGVNRKAYALRKMKNVSLLSD